jgi:hypothetical protein
LLVAIAALFVVARRRRRSPPAAIANLTPAEEARLYEFLREEH